MNNIVDTSFNAFYKKKVLVTGHTGFKGSWLCTWLNLLGAEVCGVALDPVTNPSHYLELNLVNIEDNRFDINNKKSLEKVIHTFSPEFIFHLAAQPLVRQSYIDPYETWMVNLMGTVTLLEVIKDYPKKCNVVFITSDKCYKNVEWIWGYREIDALGGDDPYSASKGAAEIAINSYLESFFKGSDLIKIASARAGNVIGGGDWSLDRIVPDCARAWSSFQPVTLRNPSSTRPWQHVLEPLSGYLNLALHLEALPQEEQGSPFNFGPIQGEVHSVSSLVEKLSNYWPSSNYIVETADIDQPKESNLLQLSCEKANVKLKWKPVLTFEETCSMTSSWYYDFYQQKQSAIALTESNIKIYSELASNRGCF